MIEYLDLDRMVESPQGPLLGYRFLNLDMSSMSLDSYIIGSLEWLASETRDFFEESSVLLRGLLDKYRPIFNWALCRISLAEGPLYSQFDEDDEEETRQWLARTQERKRLTEGGGGADVKGRLQPLQPPRNLFVESLESGFNLAATLFNLELESLAETIATKGQGETREGAEQEGSVKDAIARFIRRAQLPLMKRGSVQERINFGMGPKSAFCDFVDVYIATLGGICKEPQHLKAKSAMRTEIWEMTTSSKEDRVPIEQVFKRITSQILKWLEAGILDTDRFSIQISKLEQQRRGLAHQQRQYRANHGQDENLGDHHEPAVEVGPIEVEVMMSFKPILVHDEVDVNGNVFDYEITAQSEVHSWEKLVEKQAREREERAVAVPVENEATAGFVGGSQKRRAPEQPRNTMKKSRVSQADQLEIQILNGDDDNLFLTTTHTPPSTLTSPLMNSDWNSEHDDGDSSDKDHPSANVKGSGQTLSASVQHLHDLLRATTGSDGHHQTTNSNGINNGHVPLTSIVPLGRVSPKVQNSGVSTMTTTAITTTSTTPSGVDRLAKLRNLIKD
ncbi:hypothetical protein EDD11_009928, partial [Mortierella claussenii]